jgi:mediator of RNA polymerase II transcription subunit 5
MDLILAGFDVLANAAVRTNGREDAHLLRSFLINKVPVLLSQLFPPGFSMNDAEVCITQALSQVDTQLFPTPSLMFDEGRQNNPYTESSREEFCGACVLHGLVNREHVERILGEMSIGYEPKKYSRDDLVQVYMSQADKIKGVVADLEKVDGNVGAVCQALVEVIRQLFNTRDTSTLKVLCTELVQKPQSLDILLLFEKLPVILAPLCQLLDKWRYEDDQAEYQPVYEDFGAILLLVLTFANRYNLSTADIGLYSAKSSVRKIINTAHLTRDMGGLSEQEKQHLGGWLHGLFDTEAGGLGDDLMSSCPPQEFYLLVAPLFCNIIVGYSQGYISDESLKSGVECELSRPSGPWYHFDVPLHYIRHND